MSREQGLINKIRDPDVSDSDVIDALRAYDDGSEVDLEDLQEVAETLQEIRPQVVEELEEEINQRHKDCLGC